MASSLLFLFAMRHRKFNQGINSWQGVMITIALFGGALFGALQAHIVQAGQDQSAAKGPVVSAFDDRIKQYMKLRDKVEKELPKLSDKSQPIEIEAHKKALQTNLIAARMGAKPGEIFTSDIADHIRNVIKQEFTGKRRRELRETVSEAQTKGASLRVNIPYPETKELIEMPPTLLLKLPLLPKDLHYRFVSHSLLLLDKEARLIVDILPNALP